MIIKIVTEFKLTVFNFAHPNQMQLYACAWTYRWTKKLWKIRTGPPGRRTVVARGPRAPGLSGRRASGSSRTADCGYKKDLSASPATYVRNQ